MAAVMIPIRGLVAQRCLYGVDKNPMAVEIAKMSIWLLTLARGEPFTFAMLRKDERLVNYGDAPEDTSFRVVLPLDE